MSNIEPVLQLLSMEGAANLPFVVGSHSPSRSGMKELRGSQAVFVDVAQGGL